MVARLLQDPALMQALAALPQGTPSDESGDEGGDRGADEGAGEHG
jgi:hypothetical protein